MSAMKIQILGPGCAKCFETEKRIHSALSELGVTAEVEHVHDPKVFARLRVLFTPAVVVDGEVKMSGRVPAVEELKKLLEKNWSKEAKIIIEK